MCVLIGHLIKRRSVLEKQSSSVVKSVQQIDLRLIIEMAFIFEVLQEDVRVQNGLPTMLYT